MNVSSVLAASAVVSIAPVSASTLIGAFLLLMSFIVMLAKQAVNDYFMLAKKALTDACRASIIKW